jgi:hypothetical protein
VPLFVSVNVTLVVGAELSVTVTVVLFDGDEIQFTLKHETSI